MTKELSRRATLIAAGLLPLGWGRRGLAGAADLTSAPTARLVTWSITYGDLGSPVTMAHFHDGGTGQNGKVEIWLTKKGEPVSSPIKGSATLTPDQAQEFLAGDLYINVHTKDHPAGAIRGQVVPPKS